MPTNVDGLMVFGRPSAQVTRGQMRGLSDGADVELHLSKHFQSLNLRYVETLVGREYPIYNRDSKQIEYRIVTSADIAEALATPGSKFLPGVERLRNPRELMELVKAEAMNRATEGTLAWFDFGFAYKTYFIVNFGYRIGFTGTVLLDSLSREECNRVVRQKRGKFQEDDLMVNVIFGHSGILTTRVAVVIGLIKGLITSCPEIFTAYPGELEPSLPNDHQEEEESKYCKKYWADRAFIG